MSSEAFVTPTPVLQTRLQQHEACTTSRPPRVPVTARVSRRARTQIPPPPSTRSPTRAPLTKEAIELLFESAKAEEKRGDLANAVRMYENLLELDDSLGRAWVRYAMILRRKGEFVAARELLMRALKANPTNAILWQNWADLEKTAGNFGSARKLFRKAMEANARLPSLFHSWGSMEARLGDLKEAKRIFREGLSACPDYARLHHALGVLEDKSGNARAARDALADGLRAEPDNPHLHHAMGVVEYKAGRVAAAREWFSRATQVSPRHTLAWLARGQLEELEGSPDMARKYYSAGTRAGGGRGAVQIWQAWARMEEKGGNFNAAIDLYERAVEAHPGDAMLFCAWGKLVLGMGLVTDARALFRRGLEVDATKAYVWQSLALLEKEQLGLAKARELFIEGANRSRGREVAALYHAHAALEWENDSIDAARRLFQKAVDVVDDEGWLWLWFARFELDQGNDDLGKHFIARSINADPRDGAPWRTWAELERRQGAEEKARYMFRRAANLESDRALYEIDPQRPLGRPWRAM